MTLTQFRPIPTAQGSKVENWRPWYKKRWPWVLAVVALIGIAVGLDYRPTPKPPHHAGTLFNGAADLPLPTTRYPATVAPGQETATQVFCHTINDWESTPGLTPIVKSELASPNFDSLFGLHTLVMTAPDSLYPAFVVLYRDVLANHVDPTTLATTSAQATAVCVGVK